MENNSEDFKILLNAAFDVSQIKKQLNNIKGLTVKVGVDTAGIKQSIQNAINDASKGAPNVSTGAPSSNNRSGTGSASLNATAKQIERIQTLLQGGKYSSQISDLVTGFKRLGVSAQETAKKVQSIRTAYNTMKSVSGDELVTAQKAFNLELTKGQSELHKMRTDASEVADALKTAKLSNDITDKLNKNTAMTKKAKEELRAYVKLLNSGTKSSGERQAIQQDVNDIMTEQRAMGRLGGSWRDTLNKGIKKFTEWGLASGAVMRVVNEIREGIQTVEDLDEALTNINYTMDVSSAQLKEIGSTAVRTSKELHTSLSTVMDAVKTYANANETAESIIEKAKPTIMMSNVSGMNVEDTVDILQGTMEQFDLAEDKLMHISDVIETVSASMPYDFAKGIKELSEGIKASGSVAKDSGYELENYTALLGTLISKTRQSGSEIGRALRTMFVRTTKASSSALAGGEVSEEDISNAEAALRRVGIEVRSDTDTFRDFDEIMGDLYEKVDSLSDVDLSNIAYEVASKIVLEYIVIYSVYTQKIGISVKSR